MGFASAKSCLSVLNKNLDTPDFVRGFVLAFFGFLNPKKASTKNVAEKEGGCMHYPVDRIRFELAFEGGSFIVYEVKGEAITRVGSVVCTDHGVTLVLVVSYGFNVDLKQIQVACQRAKRKPGVRIELSGLRVRETGKLGTMSGKKTGQIFSICPVSFIYIKNKILPPFNRNPPTLPPSRKATDGQ